MAAVNNILRVLTQNRLTLHLRFIGLSGIPYQCKYLFEQYCHPEMEPSHQTSKGIKLPMQPPLLSLNAVAMKWRNTWQVRFTER